MPVTLAQAQVNTQSDVDYMVIDNLRRYSWLLDQIVFDDTVTPGTGGASLEYAYTRLITAAPAQFRNFNEEYPTGQATRQRFSVVLKPLGGAFTVDKKLANLGNPRTNELNFQFQQLITSIRTRFQQEVILGDIASAVGFDGLSKLLVGTSTEYYPGTAGANFANWSPGTIITQPLAMAALDDFDIFLSNIVPSHVGGGDQGEPGALPAGVKAILGNTRGIVRLRALARWAGMFTEDKDDLGRKVERYGDWVLVDIGDRHEGAAPIIPTETRDTDLTGGVNNQTNLTDLFAVTFGIDSFHGAAMAGVPLLETVPPDFSTPGRLKTGEAEMGPLAMCLKNTRGAGVYRNVKVG